MPRTQRVEDTASPQCDHDVLQAFLQVACPNAAGATEFKTGIRNELGEIYRVFFLFGLRERVNFELRMLELGFENENAFGNRRVATFDSVYSQS